jgi:hypothetical protein
MSYTIIPKVFLEHVAFVVLKANPSKLKYGQANAINWVLAHITTNPGYGSFCNVSVFQPSNQSGLFNSD